MHALANAISVTVTLLDSAILPRVSKEEMVTTGCFLTLLRNLYWFLRELRSVILRFLRELLVRDSNPGATPFLGVVALQLSPL